MSTIKILDLLYTEKFLVTHQLGYITNDYLFTLKETLEVLWRKLMRVSMQCEKEITTKVKWVTIAKDDTKASKGLFWKP